MLWPAAPISDQNQTALAGSILQASIARWHRRRHAWHGLAFHACWRSNRLAQKDPAQHLEETENPAASPPLRYKNDRQAEWPYVAHLDRRPGVAARICSSPERPGPPLDDRHPVTNLDP